jgi:peptidyl-prolyl cis-trans isomerase B (cyclophilin B)
LLAAAAAQAGEERYLEPNSTTLGDATVTDRAFLDIGLCPEGVRSNRKLGDKTILCTDPEPLGRLVLNLYGNAAPGTVANFKALLAAGSLNGTCFSKIVPGQWLVAGQQGPRRSGLLEAPPGLPPNPDTLNAAAFRLRHDRPGTLSLNLSENEDDAYLRNGPGYRNLSFLITTGPGLAYSLDGENIVFGAVAGTPPGEGEGALCLLLLALPFPAASPRLGEHER